MGITTKNVIAGGKSGLTLGAMRYEITEIFGNPELVGKTGLGKWYIVPGAVGAVTLGLPDPTGQADIVGIPTRFTTLNNTQNTALAVYDATGTPVTGKIIWGGTINNDSLLMDASPPAGEQDAAGMTLEIVAVNTQPSVLAPDYRYLVLNIGLGFEILADVTGLEAQQLTKSP